MKKTKLKILKKKLGKSLFPDFKDKEKARVEVLDDNSNFVEFDIQVRPVLVFRASENGLPKFKEYLESIKDKIWMVECLPPNERSEASLHLHVKIMIEPKYYYTLIEKMKFDVPDEAQRLINGYKKKIAEEIKKKRKEFQKKDLIGNQIFNGKRFRYLSSSYIQKYELETR